MKIAILHYHLNRGGVTQVILNHLASLAAAGRWGGGQRVAVLYGGRREGWPEVLPRELRQLRVELHEVPELDYDAVTPTPTPHELAERVKAVLTRGGFVSGSTILHVHNHALGKNRALPAALGELAGEGFRLLLQIHDFAEDFRPTNYRTLAESLPGGCRRDLPALLYPQAAQIHYALLNQRDFTILRNAGVPAQRLHRLPNPVAAPGALPERGATRNELASRLGLSAEHRLLLYPVRGIRRKNLGEALLWSVLAGPRTSMAVTLPPVTLVEHPAYQGWKQFAAAWKLNCHFELGSRSGLSYAGALAAADQILTTSVAEGFGMVFLEAWLAGRELVGRDLPEITADFVQAGMRLDRLQPLIRVPLEWVGGTVFRRSMREAYVEALRAYDKPIPPVAELEAEIERLIEDDCIDFARLGTSLQRRVLERILEDASRRATVLEKNRVLAQCLEGPVPDAERIRHNAEVVARHFSTAGTGERLRSIYDAVASSGCEAPADGPLNGEAVLAEFLSLSRFYPLRTES